MKISGDDSHTRRPARSLRPRAAHGLALLATLCVLCLLCMPIACDAPEPRIPDEAREVREEPYDVRARKASVPPRASDLRARADDAFATERRSPSRTRSRIGPQPWPEDLPRGWPRPERARVVADSVREPGDRLLLVDLPESPDQEIERFDAALRDRGFIVARPETRKNQFALHALRGEDEAVLRFSTRDNRTRLEILFIGPSADPQREAANASAS